MAGASEDRFAIQRYIDEELTKIGPWLDTTMRNSVGPDWIAIERDRAAQRGVSISSNASIDDGRFLAGCIAFTPELTAYFTDKQRHDAQRLVGIGNAAHHRGGAGLRPGDTERARTIVDSLCAPSQLGSPQSATARFAPSARVPSPQPAANYPPPPPPPRDVGAALDAEMRSRATAEQAAQRQRARDEEARRRASYDAELLRKQAREFAAVMRAAGKPGATWMRYADPRPVNKSNILRMLKHVYWYIAPWRRGWPLVFSERVGIYNWSSPGFTRNDQGRMLEPVLLANGEFGTAIRSGRRYALVPSYEIKDADLLHHRDAILRRFASLLLDHSLQWPPHGS
jgi:hypothetical protein